MMNQRFKSYLASLQQKPAVVAGHVASVALDPDTGQQTHAQIAVGANLLKVKLDAFAPALAQGDAVRLAQYGQAASAEYKLAGLEAGGRSNTGLFPIMNDGTVLGGNAYPGGDFIFGKLDEGNIHVEAQTGRLYHRVGLDVYGIEYPNGTQLQGHCVLVGGEWVPDGPNLLLSPSALRLRNGLLDTIRLEANGTAWLEKGLIVSPSGVIQVGSSFGAHIRLGKVTELDADGNPITELFDRYAIRAVDASGLPRIALLTGTPDAPFSPAWFLGLETDTHYLRYQNGLLRVQGEGIFERGRVGGFILTPNYLESVNGRVRLVSAGGTGGGYAEGITLMGDVADAAGIIRWVDPQNKDWNVGLEYVGRESSTANTYVKYAHVSTPEGQAGYTKHVWVAGGWGAYNRALAYDSEGALTGVIALEANSISAHPVFYNDSDPRFGEPIALRFDGLFWERFVPPTAIPLSIWDGTNTVTVGRLATYSVSGEGTHVQTLVNLKEIPIALDTRHPTNASANGGTLFLLGLKLKWKKTATGACLNSLKLVSQKFSDGSKATHKTLSNVEQGSAAGLYTSALQAESDAPLALAPGMDTQYFVTVEAKGANAGELLLLGVEMTLCDGTYKDINYVA